MAMKAETEQRYYSRLWNIIHEKTNDSAFYQLNSRGNAEFDTAALAGFVVANYPASVSHAIPLAIYQMPKTAFSENISRLLVNNSRKGFVVALKGKDGRHTIMANGGNGTEPNKKRTLAFAIPSPRDQDELRKAIALRIIKSDIEFVMRKNLRLKSNASMAAVLSSVQTNTATPKGAFEKHFKSLIREQGASASPVAAARYLFAAMPYTEKRKLGISLNAMNIKTNQELERLLHKWTAEALKGIAAQAPSRIKKHEPEHER